MIAALETRCCIAGGGPAGVMLGFLLARAGVDVIVLEKHADFFRDFRGDTIHPSTLEVMYELGLLDAFLKRPHQELRFLNAQIGRTPVAVADFTHVPTHCKFLAFMPQWDFLDFLAQEGKRYPSFRLMMNAECTDLVLEAGRVAGVRVATPGGELEIRADLTVGADGRSSLVREKAGLEILDLGAPIDALWFRISRKPDDPPQTFGRVDRGRILVMLNREEYWQCAFVIRKGGFDELQQRGLAAFQADIAYLAPSLSDRVQELAEWNDIKLLTVRLDRLRRWFRPGLLCIGDAAHAMSPIGGIGINLAVQDAVAAANILAAPLLARKVRVLDLRRIQRRRILPTFLTQALQATIQNRVIFRVLSGTQPVDAPRPMLLLNKFPVLRRIPAYVVGIGFRPEHVRTRSAS